MGKGTGLGLATVYGIVMQNKGAINVSSSPGKGTTFRIYIPAGEGRAAEGSSTPIKPTPMSGSETILLVEDEPMVLELGTMMLKRLGYRVLSASTPSEAIKLASERGSELDLLITDVVMPEMNGVELAERVKLSAPRIRCLFVSGYHEDALSSKDSLDPELNLVRKPFTLQELSKRVKRILER